MKNKDIKKYLNSHIKKEKLKYNRVLDAKLNQFNYLKYIDLVVIPLSELKSEGHSYIYNNNDIHFWISDYDIDLKNNCVYCVKGHRSAMFQVRGICESYQFDNIKKAARIEGWATYELIMIKDVNIFEERRKAQEKKPGRGSMIDINAYYINHKNDLKRKAAKLKDERLYKQKAYELMHQALHQLERDPKNRQVSEDLDQCIYILKKISQNYDYYNYKDIVNQLHN